VNTIRRSSASLIVVTVVLGAAAGCDGEGPRGSATAEGPPPLAVEITGTDLHAGAPRTLRAGKTFTLYGRLRGGTRAQRARAVVEVYASAYPHRPWRRVASKRGGDEVLGFRLAPAINTRYELRLADRRGVTSNRTGVFVDLPGRLRAVATAPGLVQASYRVRAHRPLTPANGVVYFYIRPGNRGPLIRVASARPHRDGSGGVVSEARLEHPAATGNVLVVSCAEGLVAKGQGSPAGSDPACGAPTLRPTRQRIG
jgi:hypothetical protein